MPYKQNIELEINIFLQPDMLIQKECDKKLLSCTL